MIWAWEQRIPRASDKMILLFLANSTKKGTDTCWPSVDRISTCTGLSERTIRYGIDRLIKGKFISEIQGLRTNKSFSSKTYTLKLGTYPNLRISTEEGKKSKTKPMSSESSNSGPAMVAPHQVQWLHPCPAMVAPPEPVSIEPENNEPNTASRKEEEEKAKFMEGFNRLPKAWQASVLKDNPKIAAKFMVVRRSDLDGYLD